MRKQWIILLAIVLLGAVLRFYALTQVPSSLNWDEVAFGYNAYSLLETGKDEYGKVMPLYFRSLDDYKRPVYMYAVVASMKVFGINDFAVRFPAAFFGTATIVLLYFLVKALGGSEKMALCSSLILAILPWHIFFTRPAFEASIGFFLTGLGILAFLYTFKKSILFLPLSVLAFGLSQYSYLSQRVVVPLLVITLLILFREQINSLWKNRTKKTILVVSLSAFLAVGFGYMLYLDAKAPEGSLRYKATNIFDHSEYVYNHTNEEIAYDGTLGINLPRRIFHNNFTTSLGLVTRAYLSHFSPDFFFFEEGPFQHPIPGVGLLLLWMIVPLLYGIYVVAQEKKKLTEKSVLFVWFLGAPIASAVTYQVPHALRAAEMILPTTIFIGVGCVAIVQWIRQLRKTLMVAIFTVSVGYIVLSFGYFVHQYFTHLSFEKANEWVYGREQMVENVAEKASFYDTIIVSTSLEWSHIYFLWYTKYDPNVYLSEGGTKSGGFAEEGNRFGKYEFHTFTYVPNKLSGKKILYVGKPDELKGAHILNTISYPNGTPIIQIAD